MMPNINLCQYSDLFGKPNTGLHTYRFLNIAIVDVIATFLLGIFIKEYFLKDTSILYINIFLFILGIIIHRMFCVETTIDKILFK
jgi:hypothetical protein